MNRRKALKTLLVAGGVIVIPSCLYREKEASIPLQHLEVDARGEKTLAELVGVLIPTTDTPGAKDTYTHLFVLNMMDDCFDRKAQAIFSNGLKEVDRVANDRYGAPFTTCSGAQREELVAGLEQDKNGTGDLALFYTTVKKLTLQGYLNSEYVLTRVFKYELVPGRYNGAAPVKYIHHTI